MTFKIGDNIIMTADSGKGLVLSWCGASYYRQLMMTNGDYNGRIIKIEEDRILVEYKWGASSNVLYFNLDGSCSTHPGMSIRLAEEETICVLCKINTTNHSNKICEECWAELLSPRPVINSLTAPSQWIEGRVPQDYQGWVILGRYDLPDGDIQWKQRSTQVMDIKYSHYILIQLPPPPPVKEVVAFGFLECVSKAEYDDIEYIEKARRFYSQPATAEVLNRYLTTGEGSKAWECGYLNMTLDQYLNWAKKQVYYGECKLFFTPAALEKLGIK